MSYVYVNRLNQLLNQYETLLKLIESSTNYEDVLYYEAELDDVAWKIRQEEE